MKRGLIIISLGRLMFYQIPNDSWWIGNI